MGFSGTAFRLVYKYSRSPVAIRLMIILNLLLLLSFFFYASDAAHLSWEDIDTGGKLAITRSLLSEEWTNLVLVVDSPENKRIFAQLQNADDSFYDVASNVVGTIKYDADHHFQLQPYVANGYIGARIPNLGQGFTLTNELNGWPLFNKRFAGAFIAGFYDIQKNTTGTNFPELLDNGYESVIAAVPQWTSLELSTEINGTTYVLDPEGDEVGSIQNYTQSLSLSDGVVTTEFIWLDNLYVKYQVLAHRKFHHTGVVLLDVHNLNSSDITVKVSDKLDFHSSKRCQFIEAGHDSEGIYIRFQPHEVDYVDGLIYSRLNRASAFHNTTTSIFAEVNETIPAMSSTKFTKVVGIASTDISEITSDNILQFSKDSIPSTDFNSLLKSHQDEWDQVLDSSIEFDDPLFTMTSRASLFHLAANTRPSAEGVTAALGVSGLSSDSYAGMVFWDTDLWMLNAMLPFIPDHAKSLVNYRVHTHKQAQENLPEGYGGAVYPWTSGRFGNCTATGPCMDYEYHINIAVSFAAWQIFLSGSGDDDYLRDVALPLITDAAEFMADYVKYNDTLNEYTTSNLTDPDEYANHVDNGAYTNAGISLLMKYAIAASEHLDVPVPANFTNIIGNLNLPISEDDVTLEYTGMNSSVGIKQADVIMITYPLENEMISEDQAYTNMQFYAEKQVSYGPAMTFPIFSIVSSALSSFGCSSQSYLYKAVIPFLRAPFAQFLEQNNDVYESNGGTNPAFPFLTAHGGFLQSVLQGLTGLRFDYEIVDGRIERMLKVDPIDIALFKNITYKGIKYMNTTLDLATNGTHLTIENQGETTITIKVADRNIDAGRFHLLSGGSLHVPLTSTKQASPESVCECQHASFMNVTDSAFGDSALLINDGDNFTHWQSRFNDTTAKVLIDLKQFKNITGGEINWGDKPPKKFSISEFAIDKDWTAEQILAAVDFGNNVRYKYQTFLPGKADILQEDAFKTVINETVEITAPFDEKEFSVVQVPDRFNTSSFDYPQGINSRFLLLEFDGIHDKHPTDDFYGGATINEVMLFS